MKTAKEAAYEYNSAAIRGVNRLGRMLHQAELEGTPPSPEWRGEYDDILANLASGYAYIKEGMQ